MSVSGTAVAGRTTNVLVLLVIAVSSSCSSDGGDPPEPSTETIGGLEQAIPPTYLATDLPPRDLALAEVCRRVDRAYVWDYWGGPSPRTYTQTARRLAAVRSAADARFRGLITPLITDSYHAADVLRDDPPLRFVVKAQSRWVNTAVAFIDLCARANRWLED